MGWCRLPVRLGITTMPDGISISPNPISMSLTNTGHVELIDHPEVHAVLARWLNSR